jgi:hypothetical protein
LSGLLQYTVSDYLPLVSSNSSYAYLTTFAFLMPGEQFRLPRASKLKYRHTFQGRIHDFKLGGAYLKKLRRAEGGAKLKKTRQHNGQKKKYKRTNNDRQNIHIKLKIE